MATRIAKDRPAPAAKRPRLEFERKAFYSPAEIAKVIGVSTQTVLDRIHDGSLYAFRLSPRIYRITLASFMQFLGEPPRIKRITRKVKRLPDWDREFAHEEERR
jgi:excisionase family DNA binding protein